MNRLFILLLSFLFVSACEPDKSGDNGSSATEETTAAPSAASAMSPVDSAKLLLTEAQGLVKKGILKEIAGPEVNQRIGPIMAQFQEIYKRLTPTDTAIIYEFRMAQLRELIDLQVSQQKK